MIQAWQAKGGKVEASEEDVASWLTVMKVSKRCPKCGHAIIKLDGTCNHMTCDTAASGCGHEFCYLCAANWDKVRINSIFRRVSP
jgi:hypothetical protein